MHKLYFDQQLLNCWHHPELYSFIDVDAIPVFGVEKCNATQDNSDLVEEIEEIAYCCIRNEGYQFRMKTTSIIANWDFSSISICELSNVGESDVRYQQELNRLLHTVFCYRLIYLGGMSLHSAVTVYRDEAIAFCGLSGAGKSTQANLWKRYLGAWVLNYDKPAIMYDDSDLCMICGTPWSGKERCFINGNTPLKAIVFVEKASYNYVQKLPIAEAYSMLLLNNYVYPIDNSVEVLYDQQVERLAQKVPVYRLFCTKDVDAVRALFGSLFDEQGFCEAMIRGAKKMKIKDHYVLRNIAGEYIVIPRGRATLDFQATIVLNETGAYLWKLMVEPVTEDALVSQMIVEYDVPRDTAAADVAKFIELLRENGIIEDYVL